MRVTHRFTSAKADPSDLTLIKPSNWNDTHLVENLFFYSASDYNFTPRSPSTNLIAGITNTITLTPVPEGINATNINHYLFIMDGSHFESVKITGGDAVSGAASGTITFIPTYNYTAGNWTIRSVAGGIPEAYWASNGYGQIQLDSTNFVEILGPVFFSKPNSVFSLVGVNQYYVGMARNMTYYPNGDIFTITDSVLARFIEFGINAAPSGTNTTGAVLNAVGAVSQVGSLICENILIQNGIYGIAVNGCASSYFNNIHFQKADASIGVGIIYGMPVPGIYNNNSTIISCRFGYTNKMSAGIELQSIDGLQISNCNFGGPIQVAIRLNAIASAAVLNIYITNNFIDACEDTGIRIAGTLGTMGMFLITNNHIRGQYVAGVCGLGTGIDLGHTVQCNAGDVTIEGNEISQWNYSGILVGVPTLTNPAWSLRNNSVLSNNRGNNNIGEINLLDGSFGVQIDGNVCGDGIIGLPDISAYGISAAGDLTNCSILNNICRESVTGIIVSGDIVGCFIMNNDVRTGSGTLGVTGTKTNSIIKNNLGVDDTYDSVASDASIALPLHSTIVVTGTTGVGTITNIWNGRQFTLITTDGAVTFTAGATIGNTFTSTQNKPINCVVVAGKVYLS